MTKEPRYMHQLIDNEVTHFHVHRNKRTILSELNSIFVYASIK